MTTRRAPTATMRSVLAVKEWFKTSPTGGPTKSPATEKAVNVSSCLQAFVVFPGSCVWVFG